MCCVCVLLCVHGLCVCVYVCVCLREDVVVCVCVWLCEYVWLCVHVRYMLVCLLFAHKGYRCFFLMPPSHIYLYVCVFAACFLAYLFVHVYSFDCHGMAFILRLYLK